MKPFRSNLRIPIYRTCILLVVCKSVQDAAEEYKFSTEGEIAGCCITCDNGNVLIILGSGSITSDTVAHECYHAAMSIMETIGNKATYKNQEPHAYLIGHIVGWVTGELKKRGYRIKQ